MEPKEKEILIEINNIQKKRIAIAKRFINCENYIGLFLGDTINIFELSENLDISPKSSISTGNFIENIDFNHKYKDILLSISSDDYMKLYKITEQNNFEVISTFNGPNSKSAKHAKFNPVNENLIISSKTKIIDIWDVTRYTNIMNIQNKDIIYDLKWDTT